MDSKEFESLVPKLRTDFNPTRMSDPLDAREIEMLVVIDGKTSVASLATLKSLTTSEVQQLLQSLEDKEVVDLGRRAKAEAARVTGARSYVPKGPSKLNKRLEADRRMTTPPPSQRPETPVPPFARRRTTPPPSSFREGRQPITADIVGLPVDHVPESLRPQPEPRPSRRATPAPASSLEPSPQTTPAPQSRRASASSPTYRPPSGRRPTRPPTSRMPSSSPSLERQRATPGVEEKAAPPIGPQYSEIEHTDWYAERPSQEPPKQPHTSPDSTREEKRVSAPKTSEVTSASPLDASTADLVETHGAEAALFTDEAERPQAPEQPTPSQTLQAQPLAEHDSDASLVAERYASSDDHKAPGLTDIDGMFDEDEMTSLIGEAVADTIQMEEHQLVAHVMMSFARVTSSLQLYDPRNDAVYEALVALYAALNQCLTNQPTLTLEVKPWEFVYDGEVVYRNREREHSLAFKLFRDGVRSLTFKRGLPWQELAQLLKILGVRYNGVHMHEDDMVTLMWKADFTSIEAVAIEGFELAERAGGHASLTPEDVLVQAMRDAHATTSEALQASLREEEQRAVFQQIKPSKVQPTPLTQDAISQLQLQDSTRFYPARVVRLLGLLEAETRHPEAPMDLGPIERLLQEYVDYLLTEGMLIELHQLLMRLRRWNVSEKAEHLWHLYSMILAGLEEERQLRRLLDGTPYEGDRPAPILVELLRLMQDPPVDRLFSLLARESYKPLQRTIRFALLALTDNNPTPFVEQVAGAEPEYLQQLMRCLHQIGDGVALSAIATQLSSPDTALRELARGLLDDLLRRGQANAASRDVIGQLITAPDADIRMRGYTLIQASQDKGWSAALLDEIESQAGQWQQAELEQVMSLAAELTPEKARPLMLEWARPPGRFQLTGERSGRKKQRLAAIKALAIVGGEEADAMLKQVHQKCPELKDECVAALRELRRRSRGFEGQSEASNAPLAADTAPGKFGIDERDDRPAVSGMAAFGGQDIDIKGIQEEMHRAQQHASGGRSDLSNLIRKQGYTLIMQLHMLIKNSRLYDKDNRIFENSFDQFADLLHGMLEEFGELTLLGVEGQLYVNETRIRLERESAAIGQELYEDLARLGVGGLTFLQPMSADHARAFVQRIAGYGQDQQGMDLEQLSQALREAGLLRYLELSGKVTYKYSGGDESQIGATRSLLEAYTAASNALIELRRSIAEGRAPNPLPLRRASNAIVDAIHKRTAETNPLELLALGSASDPLEAHTIEVAMYATLIGETLGLSRESLADLAMASFYHDIGHDLPSGGRRIAHTRRGLRFMAQHHGFQDATIKRLLGVAEHHLEFQHKHKPQLHSRILKVADTFSLLSSPLSGQHRVSPAVALRLLWGGINTHFDPELVQALTLRVGLYPPGTLVALRNKSVGVSLGYSGKSEHFARPRLLQIATSGGKRCDGPIIDLNAPAHRELEVYNALKADDKAHKHIKRLLVEMMKKKIALETPVRRP